MDGFGAHRQPSKQSKQTRSPRLLAELDKANRLFWRAEAEIALLRRCQPSNAAAECASGADALRRGSSLRLQFHYPAPAALTGLRVALEGCQRSLERAGELATLYSERARELALDAALAEQIGRPSFFALARQRYPVGGSLEWSQARSIAQSWTTACSPRASGPSYRSDDVSAPESLGNVLGRWVRNLGLPVRIQIVTDQSSRAATADGVIFVRAGVLLSAPHAEGIAAHEVLGHALPRLRARREALGLFRVGSSGAGEDEEGRALALEQQLGWLPSERRWELGARHLAALAVADGADAGDAVRLLLNLGSSIETALQMYARIARGGGLCRELAYLPAWLRLQRALLEEPDLESWLARGRLSLAASRVLRGLLATPHGVARVRG